MAESRYDDRIVMLRPAIRGVLPLDRFHVPSRLARTVRSEPFDIRIDTAFEAVIDGCASPAPGRWDTWINGPIRALYATLHRQGCVHSVECWADGALVAGLYGVRIGGAFFGESMFTTVRDASKVALVQLAARLNRAGFALLDAQFMNDHLVQFGAVDAPHRIYMQALRPALDREPDMAAFRAPMGGAEALAYLQPTTQAS